MSDTIVHTLDLQAKSARISPLWFGHNLEHTRSCVWQGLSAQLLRNRKFHGIPQRNGVANQWYPLGPPATHFALGDRDAYTMRYDPLAWHRRKEILCQQICNVTDGVQCGIGQNGLNLAGGQRYELRVALRSDRALAASIQVVADDTAKPCFDQSVDVRPGGWCEFEFSWEASDECSGANLQIVFERSANLYVGAVSLLPADNFHGMRQDVIRRLQEIGCPLLRWPGGNFAGDYRWQDGLLPVDRRSPLAAKMQIETLGHSGGYDCHEIGTDEFISLCRVLGAQPYITINPTWEGPESAAAWVEYCNGAIDTQWGGLRAKRGYPEPFGVKYWSLGNEFGQSHMEGPRTPADYVRHLRPHAELMRAADPSIELVASGDWRQDEWFTDCLVDFADMINHVSHHHYTGGESPASMRNYLGESADEDFRAVATNPGQVILPELAEVHRKLREHAPAGRTFGITFDEWNVWHAWYRVPGVVEGIHNASMLNLLCREADQVGVSLGCFFEPVNEGAILVKADSAVLPAGGKVFPLFKAHYGNTRLDLGPQDTSTDVDVAASLDEESGKIVLTVVNRNPQTQRRVSLILKDHCLTTVEATRLCSSDFLPNSDFEASTFSFASCEDRLEFEMPEHSVARITAKVTRVGQSTHPESEGEEHA